MDDQLCTLGAKQAHYSTPKSLVSRGFAIGPAQVWSVFLSGHILAAMPWFCSTQNQPRWKVFQLKSSFFSKWAASAFQGLEKHFFLCEKFLSGVEDRVS